MLMVMMIMVMVVLMVMVTVTTKIPFLFINSKKIVIKSICLLGFFGIVATMRKPQEVKWSLVCRIFVRNWNCLKKI